MSGLITPRTLGNSRRTFTPPLALLGFAWLTTPEARLLALFDRRASLSLNVVFRAYRLLLLIFC